MLCLIVVKKIDNDNVLDIAGWLYSTDCHVAVIGFGDFLCPGSLNIRYHLFNADSSVT